MSEQRCPCCKFPQCSAKPVCAIVGRRSHGVYCKAHAMMIFLSKLTNYSRYGFSVRMQT